MAVQDPPSGDRLTYRRVGYTMLGGLLLSVAVMIVGLITVAVQGRSDAGHVYPLADLWGRLASGAGPAILDLGILLLFATPLAAVVVAGYQFARAGDTRFAAVTGTLGLLLLISIAVAVH